MYTYAQEYLGRKHSLGEGARMTRRETAVRFALGNLTAGVLPET